MVYIPLKFAKFSRTPFFTEHLWWLLLENLFRSFSRERTEVYFLSLLVHNVSSYIWRTLMFGFLSYFSKGDQTETVYITKSTSLHYFAITCYWSGDALLAIDTNLPWLLNIMLNLLTKSSFHIGLLFNSSWSSYPVIFLVSYIMDL